MPLTLRGYYAILDVKSGQHAREGQGRGTAGIDRVVARAAGLLAARPCVLQLRAKGIADRTVVDIGRELGPLCRAGAIPFCINDRVDLAVLLGADMVHLGQDDLPVAAARRVMAEAGGASATLMMGLSTHNRAQAHAAMADGVDYIGFGPVFPTLRKASPDPVVGLAALSEIARALPIPVVAIGGIAADNVAAVAAAGAAAAAVIGAVEDAADPTAAGRAIAAAWAR